MQHQQPRNNTRHKDIFSVEKLPCYLINFDISLTLKCLSIGTPKAINFPFVSNEKLMFLGVPVFKHVVMRL